MAGIEQLEIHSKSYIVRWVKVEEGFTISWSVQPHKKSINFGIVKHPGSGGTNLASALPEESTLAEAQVDGATDSKSGLFSKKDSNTAQEQLVKKGFIAVKWHGRCEADKVSMGTYDVPKAQGGMFGLVFDNTFSKQTSKTATFVLLTYPTGAPPQTSHHLSNLQAGSNASSSRTSLGKHGSPRLAAVASESFDSLHSHRAGGRAGSVAGRSDTGTPAATGAGVTYHVGALLKRRRKKGQGYARRFFSLDYTSCTLSYYHNRNSSALRGAIPLSLAAIAADERRREISIDSGAEIWHLKASSAKDFSEWARALEKASRIALGLETLPNEPSSTYSSAQVVRQGTNELGGALAAAPPNTQQEEDREWQQVEALVSRMVGTRDALRRLVKDLAAQRHAPPHHYSSFLSPGTPTLSEESDGYFSPQPEKRPFWKRKPSTSPLIPQGAVSPPTVVPAVTTNSTKDQKGKAKGKTPIPEERSTQDHCTALLSDLDSVVVEFSTLLATSKRRRLPLPEAASRKSYESTSTTDEFFDAEAGETDRSQLLRMDQSEEDTPASDADEVDIHDDSSVSSVEDDDDVFTADGSNLLYPAKPKSLAPLPVPDAVSRRITVPAATVAPPSLIAFVRKNVGKDFTTISMPVSANEPTSLLQRVSEQLEYASLLDRAARATASPRERLLCVAAFAVSHYSGSRARERAIRKPFNPLLGETFELLRTERDAAGGGGGGGGGGGSCRVLAEKVCHRPVRLALQADGARWSLAQSPAPTQKFWGKSAELATEGRVRLVLRLNSGRAGADGGTGGGGGGGNEVAAAAAAAAVTEERYSWAMATVFLRNVVMGEKYVEPVGTMTVLNDTTGARATIEFRSRGMFGGRSEDVVVETYGPDGQHAGLSLAGTWTGGLRVVENTSTKGGSGSGGGGASPLAGEEIWRPGKLVDNAAQTYGMTVFAAGLNEITSLEKGRLPPTDSRLRPDQRLAEQGKLDEAEAWKVKLEEAQRKRRKALEEKGEEHRPRWFVKAGTGPDGEEVWRMKTGKDGYWEERERGKGQWPGVADIFSG